MKKKRKTRVDKGESALKRAERVWKYVFIDGMSYTDAWKKAYPFTKAKKSSWVLLARRACDRFLEHKREDVDDMLRASDLDLPKVVQEIHKGLTQKRCIVYKGAVIKDENGQPILLDDNVTQQRMREALIRIHGLEKQKAEVRGEITHKHELSPELSKMVDKIVGIND